jgi:hypothetical protein
MCLVLETVFFARPAFLLDETVILKGLQPLRGSVVIKALCYKPEGLGAETRWGEFLNLPNPSGRSSPWGLLSL